jgi:hypothetical protein
MPRELVSLAAAGVDQFDAHRPECLVRPIPLVMIVGQLVPLLLQAGLREVVATASAQQIRCEWLLHRTYSGGQSDCVVGGRREIMPVAASL